MVKKSIYTAQNTYTDLYDLKRSVFPELTVKMQLIDTTLLLLESTEDNVLITVFKHLADFARQQPENIDILKEKNVLDLLLDQSFYITNENIIVKRFALYIATSIVETMRTLADLDTERTREILFLCLKYYDQENDNFCLEYLSVIINKCLDDPNVAVNILEMEEFLLKFFGIIRDTDNPDTLLHSIQALKKILDVLNGIDNLLCFVNHPEFPIDRVICELTNEFVEIRSAALPVVQRLMWYDNEESPFNKDPSRGLFVLQQLTKLFCDHEMVDNASAAIDTLAIGFRSEDLAKIFFEYSLFDKLVLQMQLEGANYPPEIKCQVTAVFAEVAKFTAFHPRLQTAQIPQWFLDCLLDNETETSTYVITGLNCLMKYPEAANTIVEAYPRGAAAKLIQIMQNPDKSIKTREQAGRLIGNLVVFSFHPTAKELFELRIPEILAEIFSQDQAQLSIDYITSLLKILELLAKNNEYRQILGSCALMAQNLALLLKDSYATALLVSHIFRCLCTLVEEPVARSEFLGNYVVASLKRALKSLANQVKTAGTNFVVQTARFPEFVEAYIELNVLEVLILYQKHAFCVPTWGLAIENVLSRCPTLKFCIRNQLGFTDFTVGYDFYVSKKKFEDFRQFQAIIKDDVSPLHPIILVNFNRTHNPSEMNIHVPQSCLLTDGVVDTQEWVYCRCPEDHNLPKFLISVLETLENRGLTQNPDKMKRCVDFDKFAKKAKVIAEFVASVLSADLKPLDLNSPEECSNHIVNCHLKNLCRMLHCNIIPIGLIRSGCQFERAVLFKCLADQAGLPSTLQRSVDGRILFNEVPLPVEIDQDVHCEPRTLKFMPWRMLRPTHIIDLIYNVGELYPLQSRQALQYLRLY